MVGVDMVAEADKEHSDDCAAKLELFREIQLMGPCPVNSLAG